MNSRADRVDDAVDFGGVDDRRAAGRGRDDARRDQPRRSDSPCACHGDRPEADRHGRASPPVRSARAGPWPPQTPDRAPAPSARRSGPPADPSGGDTPPRAPRARAAVRRSRSRSSARRPPPRTAARGDRCARAAGAPRLRRATGRCARRSSVSRLAVLLALGQPPAALQVELRELALIALRGGRRSPGPRRWRATTRDPCAMRSSPRGTGFSPRGRRSAYFGDSCPASSRSRRRLDGVAGRRAPRRGR